MITADRRLMNLSTMSAKAAIEHKMSGQMGQPAACMIENKVSLSATVRGVESKLAKQVSIMAFDPVHAKDFDVEGMGWCAEPFQISTPIHQICG
jgi:hypothetical protein